MTAHTPRRRSIRFAIVAVVCLLMGAATTVGIAWGFAYYADNTQPHLDGSRTANNITVFLDSRVARGALTIDLHSVNWQHGETNGREDASADYNAIAQLSLGAFAAAEAEAIVSWKSYMPRDQFVARGWPWPCLWYEWHSDYSVGGSGEPVSTGAIEVPSIQRPRSGRRSLYPLALPTRPLWKEFLLECGMYSAAWSLIFTPLPLYRAGRRRVRVSRGRCPACAYDLKGSPAGPCPECGRAG